MKQVYLFNTGSTNICFSINNGPYLNIASTSGSIGWEPFPYLGVIIFNSHSMPLPGEFGWGNNILTFYPEGVAGKPVNFEINIPKNMGINAVQIYFFCEKETSHCVIAVCVDGQFRYLLYPGQKKRSG